MKELNEKFFIPKPEPLPYRIPMGVPTADQGGEEQRMFVAYKTADGRNLAWSGTCALPEIGQDIYVMINSIGRAVVVGYFESCGYLGVMSKAVNPPKWLRDQHKRDLVRWAENDKPVAEWMRVGVGCEFGAEIALKKPAKNGRAR